ncbi:unnamed protein product [Arabidopsis arenosa]|uniref:Uncharacterized protein n=1 Tax=Arabidopsis arenosa TaxID=38785 RepID=A0A8S1ZWS6_ARAAE|nr:unnamed protein product [Arabidopsis arenosa]
MSPLRYVTALASRGGRGLLSRRSFSTSAVSKGMMERFRKLSKPVGRLTAGYLIAHREELVKEELEKDVDETKVLVEVRNMKKQMLVLWGYLSCGSMGYLAWESIQLHNALEQARQVKKKKKQELKN